MDIETSRRNDDVFLAATKTQIAFSIEFAQVARAQPASLLSRPDCSLFPIAAGDIVAPDEDFAILGELELTARQNLADRALRRAKRVIQADQGGGLRHAVALNNGVAHALEKILSFIRESCAAGNQRPEFPAKAAVDAAKHPGALEKFSASCVFKSALQPPRFALALEFPLDSSMKQIEHARHGNERGGALLPDRAKNFGNRAARRFIARIHSSISYGGRARNEVFQIVDDHGRRRARKFRLLTVPQNKLHTGILDRALHEIGGRGRVHRNNDATAQENSPETGDPFGGVRTPEKDGIARDDAAPGERRTPKKDAGVKLYVRQLFPTVAASLDDGHVATEADEFCEQTQKILSGHKRSRSFSSYMGRFYPRSGVEALRARQAVRLCRRMHLIPNCTYRATMEQALASE